MGSTRGSKPHLIGIAGASCSGKSTLADALTQRLGPADTAHITLDSYYHDLSHLAEDAILHHNLDEPAALEHALLLDNLERLHRGEAIDKPVYDHRTHTRHPESERIEPASFIIIEGLFALYWEDVRRLLHTRIFIDSTHELCFERRFKRDRNKRGRTREEVTERYNRTVGPMYDLHVLPTRRYADVVVGGTDPVSKSVADITAHIKV